ncbi:hypothetical protein SLA2020_460320 [Shorea laevis]
MGTPYYMLSELVDTVKSWLRIPRRSEPPNVSKDFWMPDQSCTVCYECDSQFTVFNRKHHCRLCGRIFCAKCTANSVPAPSNEPRTGWEDWERIRVCNYCLKQWHQGISTVDGGTNVPSPALSPSPSATSLASTKSSCTSNNSSSTVGSTPYSTGPYHCVNYTSCLSPRNAPQMNAPSVEQSNESSRRSTRPRAAVLGSSPNYFAFSANRRDEVNDEYGASRSDSETRHYSQAEDYGGAMNIDAIDLDYGSNKVQTDGDNIDGRTLNGSLLPENSNSQAANGIKKLEEVDKHDDGDERDASASAYDVGGEDTEPVDFENNGLLWLPPEPEDEEDDREHFLFDEEDDDATGEWGYRHSNSFGSRECHSRDKSIEEHRRAMKNVVEGHFRALVAQLLQVENLPVGDEDGGENWLDIITSLSWEAATLLKPDTSRGGVMDPGEYVKVKCIACGHRSESTVVKGVVCKKNVAHRRMTSKIDKPRFLILGGALEYQRVANHLSSFDTLLQQEMDHLKMAIAKIDAHHPNVLLVEKSVSRYAQEYLLAKDISLVLNIKRPLLERMARCIGAQIVPSIDHLTSQKLGYCDAFHVDKFFEEHGSAGQDGKKSTKTLMFFEGCPKPLGFTILLKGDNADELKKVKHVVQYAVFAAYHLALETSFLADEGASLLDLPLKSPITVALPDKPSGADRSISTVPGFTIPSAGKAIVSQLISEPQKPNNSLLSGRASSSNTEPTCKLEGTSSTYLSKGPISQISCIESTSSSIAAIASFNSLASLGESISSYNNEPFRNYACREDNAVGPKEPVEDKGASSAESLINDKLISDCWHLSEVSEQSFFRNQANGNMLAANCLLSPELASSRHDANNTNEEMGALKEEFPPSSSDHQSILVALSTRCVWKRSVCERAHIFRIKYYGNFDKPLGRFLQDHLFDESHHCRSCNMPSEAHVHCYTHQQGSLTISVKNLPGLHLPGEREGKIWMWHRCLLCPRINGFPPATQRVVMSDAAWGLSFGKFLELSFSNHAAASRVASCGHSLHRDCLRFYGFGRRVACFRYASIDVHSVYLPPLKLEFNYGTQEWIQKEADEVKSWAVILFNEVQNALQKISEKISGSGLPDIRMNIEELEGMLQKDKEELQESFQKAVYKEGKAGQLSIDILEINKLRRQILFHFYVWDQRLVEHASSLTNNNRQELIGSSEPKLGLKPASSVEKLTEINVSPKPGKALNNCDPIETKPNMSLNHGGSSDNGIELGENHKDGSMDQDMDKPSHSPSVISGDKSEPLESGKVVQRAHSEGEFPVMGNLSETLEAAWTGGSQPASISAKENGYSFPDSTLIDPSPVVNTVAVNSDLGVRKIYQGGPGVACSSQSASPTKKPENVENSMNVARLSSSNSYSSFGKISSLNAQKLVGDYSPSYVLSFRELEKLSGARLLLPVGVNDTVVPVYDDEPTSIIAYALVSSDYHVQMSESERGKDASDTAVALSLFDSVNLLSLNSIDETLSDSYRIFGSGEDNISRTSQGTDPLFYLKDLHARVSFTDDGPLGKVNYTVTCYHAKQFESLRRTCCPSELDFIRSLSRCKKWGAQGGKSNVFFAKTLDDRFIIKQVTKTELESFIKFAPAYFNYLSDSISKGSPTCLAKILGIYQVSSKHLKGGKDSKMDVLVMENLLFGRNVTRLYDLKGSSRSRYNPDTSGSNKVLLDQNLIEAMPTSPIFVGSKPKRLLERAVWNDTYFLASVAVMDYSLLVGVDEEKHELVLGIIDFMRQYTWDKHLETWVKTSGILGGDKNPTVISPQQYKKRFRKAMTTYFVMVPDQWTTTVIVPSGSQTDLCEENTQNGTSLES